MNKEIKELLNILPENDTNLRKFINVWKEENSKITPFVGAGLSVPIYKLWGKALNAIVKNHTFTEKTKREISDCLAKCDYEKAASIIKKTLGKGHYEEALEELFGESSITDEELAKMPVRLLPELFQETIVTTNFDRILNKIYPGIEQITMWSASKPKEKAIKSKKNQLIKIHGDINEGELILTEDDYAEYYEKSNSEHVEYLKRLFWSKTMLFLGCSLNVDRTFRLLQQIAEMGENYPHFAFMEAQFEIGSEEFQKRQTALSDAYIFCIWYPKGKHDFVEIFLQYLIENQEKSAEEIIADIKGRRNLSNQSEEKAKEEEKDEKKENQPDPSEEEVIEEGKEENSSDPSEGETRKARKGEKKKIFLIIGFIAFVFLGGGFSLYDISTGSDILVPVIEVANGSLSVQFSSDANGITNIKNGENITIQMEMNTQEGQCVRQKYSKLPKQPTIEIKSTEEPTTKKSTTKKPVTESPIQEEPTEQSLEGETQAGENGTDGEQPPNEGTDGEQPPNEGTDGEQPPNGGAGDEQPPNGGTGDEQPPNEGTDGELPSRKHIKRGPV